MIKKYFPQIIIISILIIIAILSTIPVLFVVFSTFKTKIEIIQQPFAFPKGFYLEGIAKAWVTGRFAKYFINSIVIAGASIALTAAFCSLAAYPLAKLKFRGIYIVFTLFALGFTLPFQSLMVPLFRLIHDLNLLSTYWAVILTQTAFSLPFGVFMLRTFFMEIPNEICEYSRIEGCNEFQIFYYIIIPLAKSAVVSLLIFNFISSWNDFIKPLLFIQREQFRPLTLGLMFFKSRFGNDYSLIFPGISIIISPIILFYILFSKSIIKGLTSGAVKG